MSRWNPQPAIERVLPRLVVGDCWLWPGAQDGRGYGQVKEAGRLLMAHRVVYEFLVGPIPEGLFLDHLCRVPLCCNPDHLEPVTNRENKLRARTGRCRRGHELTWTANCRQRECVTCRRARQRKT